MMELRGRILIMADVHANLPAFEAVLQAAGEVDGCIFGGDIVGYGTHPGACVALLEELFWRGFLWRYLVNMDKPFWKTEFGIKRWKPIAITIALFVLVHAPEDYLGCLVYGILISWVAIRTRSLAACVVCHGVSNFVLGVYIMATQKWGLW